jgi:anaerobic magnesium-protoporphyrin IX monomethyl ester cyclase
MTRSSDGLLLLLPPPLECFQPYPSLPVLAAYLRGRGLRVHQADLNLGFYLWLLQAERLSGAYDKGRSRLSAAEGTTDHEAAELAMRVVAGPYVASRCAEALSVIRDPSAFYRLDRYRWSLATLEQACRMWAAQWPGVHLGLGSLWLSAGPRLDRLKEIADDPFANPFHAYLEAEVARLLEEVRPSVVGVSVVQEDQVLAALTIGAIVRRTRRGTPVVLGGPLVTSMATWWGGPEVLSPFVDLLVVGPGEEALEGVLRRTALGSIPNLVAPGKWPRRLWKGSLPSMPSPDYGGLPLDQYLAPEVVFSVVATRGCYWNRCAFCNLTAHGPVYEYRGSARIAEDMARLNARHGARFFDLVGEVVPVRSLVGLSREVARRALSARWHTQSRLDRPLGRQGARTLYAGGCRRLKFGLESACTRVLGLMDKGIDPKLARQILTACRHEGVALTVYCMIGFPGEEAEEAWATAESLLADEALVQSRGFSTSFSPFCLERNARVAAAPRRYGVEVLGPKGDASVSMLYRTARGMSPDQVGGVRNDIARAFSRRCGGEAWPFASNHSLLYLEHGGSGGPTGQRETGGSRYSLQELLEGRPRVRPEVEALPMGSWAAVYDGARATPRRLGPHSWRAMELSDGVRSGRDVCVQLEADGLPPGEALMALAQALAAGVLELHR